MSPYEFFAPGTRGAVGSSVCAGVCRVYGSVYPSNLNNTNVGNTSSSSAVRPVISLDISKFIDKSIVE